MQADSRERILLAGLDTLENEFSRRPKPCLALLISRQYRLLATLSNSSENRFLLESQSWLMRYILDESHSPALKISLLDTIRLDRANR